jgi:hypothetical protein
MNFTHKSLLRTCILDFGSRRTIYQFFEKTLDDYVKLKKKKHGIHNVMNFHHKRYSDIFALYIPYDYRRIIKGMMSLIYL